MRPATMSLIAVLAPDTDEPLAAFEDMPTALAWGLQQFKGQPFVVRVQAEKKRKRAPRRQEDPAAPVVKRARPARQTRPQTAI